LRPGEERLGVDEPVLALERREMRGEGLAPTQAGDLAEERQPPRRVGIDVDRARSGLYVNQARPV